MSPTRFNVFNLLNNKVTEVWASNMQTKWTSLLSIQFSVGYHVCINVWKPWIGEKLKAEQDVNNTVINLWSK